MVGLKQKQDVKRLLSVVLALVITLGMFSFAADADTSELIDINTVNVGMPSSGNTFSYTGEPIEPLYFLYEGYDSNDHSKYLKEGVDYVVTFENNIYPDPDNSYAATATFIGIGKYTGTKTKTFSIDKFNISSRLVRIELDETIFDYTGEPICPKPHVYYDNKELVESQDYVLEYSGNVDVSTGLFGSGHITVVGINNFTGSKAPEDTYFYIAPAIETIDTVTYENRDGDKVSWSVNEEGLLWIDVQSHDGSGIPIPGEAETGYSLYYDDDAHEWVYAPGYRKYFTSVRKLKISGNVSEVSGFAHTDCLFLTDIELPDGVTTLVGNGWGVGTFGSLYNLRHINLPDSLTSIGTNALGGCPKLTVELPDNITDFHAGTGEAGQRGTKFMVTLNSTTEETLRNSSYGYYYYIKGYPDFNIHFEENSSMEGKSRTLVHYTGTERNVVIPDFVDGLSGAYGNTFSLCPVSIESEIIPGSVKWITQSLADESTLKYVEIQPGELTELSNNLLGGRNDVTIVLPDTLGTISTPFCSDYAWVLAEVDKDSYAHQYVTDHGFIEDDGSGVGRRYRLRGVYQPTETPDKIEIKQNKLADVYAAKDDGSFTLDSVTYAKKVLVPGEDYTVREKVITIKKEFLQQLELGSHEITLHYTGTAGENSEEPVDTGLTISITEPEQILIGDIDRDGKVTVKDSMVIQRYVIHLKEFDENQLIAADVYGDEKVTAKNALEIQRYTIRMSKNERLGRTLVWDSTNREYIFMT